MHVRRFTIAAGLAIALVFSTCAPAMADTIAQKQAQAASAQAKVNSLRNEGERASERYNLARSHYNALTAKERTLRAHISNLASKQKALQAKLDSRIGVMYRQGPLGVFSLLLDVHTIEGFVTAMHAMTELSKRDTSTVAELKQSRAEAVTAHVADAAPVADLFCGIGTFSLRLARRAAVTAVEGDPALLEALELAVRQARGLRGVTMLRRDLFTNPLAAAELNRFGGVVFDPPAAGAKAQAEAIARSQVARVVAVSCNPATLGRDARILVDGGYRLTRVLPVDQFLWSAEIEVVATFER